MLIICIVIIFCIILYFVDIPVSTSKCTIFGGGKPQRKNYIINLGREKSIEFLAYMAIEYSITASQMNRQMLEEQSHTFLNTLKLVIKNKGLIEDTKHKVDTLLELIPKHEKLGKPLIIRKLTGFVGAPILMGEIEAMKPSILPDTNIVMNWKKYNLLKDKFVATSQLLCDSAYNKNDVTGMKHIASSCTYKIYLIKEFFLSYTCNGNKNPQYAFIKQNKRFDANSENSMRYEKDSIQKIKNQQTKNLALVELYLSRAIKDIGIILSCYTNELLFMTHDAWAMMVANRIFNVAVLYSKPDETNYYYYSKRVVDGFTVV